MRKWEYEPKMAYVLKECTCNRCNKDISQGIEQEEALYMHWHGGYASIFGDGTPISLDLCQDCVKIILGPWLEIGASSLEELANEYLKSDLI